MEDAIEVIRTKQMEGLHSTREERGVRPRKSFPPEYPLPSLSFLCTAAEMIPRKGREMMNRIQKCECHSVFESLDRSTQSEDSNQRRTGEYAEQNCVPSHPSRKWRGEGETLADVVFLLRPRQNPRGRPKT